MWSISDVPVPVVGAPMAGGPTTAELVSAVSGGGGLGMLAAAYLSPDAVAERISAIRRAGTDQFGVNLFVVHDVPIDSDALLRYRQRLREIASEYGVVIPAVPGFDDDGYREKLDVIVAEAPPLVSFTFGLPSADDLRRLRSAGCAVGATVTTAADARAAADLGVDVLFVQGPNAGGHRSTFDPRIDPPTEDLESLLTRVRGEVNRPLIATGGVGGPGDVARLRGLGADAVSVGTLLLRSPEAGTKEVHRAALSSGEFTDTVVTRVFSGRPARGLRNRLHDELAASATAAYPHINSLTAPLRSWAASSNHPEVLNLWAGTGFAAASERPAAEIVAELAG